MNAKFATPLFGIIGLIFLMVGISSVFMKFSWINNSILKSASVVGYQIRHESTTMYAVQYAYSDGNGGTIKKTSSSLSSGKPYEISQIIEIYVSNSDVNDSEINSFAELWLSTAITCFIGIGWIFLFFKSVSPNRSP